MPTPEPCAHSLGQSSILLPVEVVIDGERGFLVDLSTAGAQLVTHTRMHPRQAINMTLADDNEAARIVRATNAGGDPTDDAPRRAGPDAGAGGR